MKKWNRASLVGSYTGMQELCTKRGIDRGLRKRMRVETGKPIPEIRKPFLENLTGIKKEVGYGCWLGY